MSKNHKQIQQQIGKLLADGQLELAEAKFRSLPLNSKLPFAMIRDWIEVLSCTGWSSLHQLLSTFNQRHFSDTEKSVLKSYQAVDYWLSWNLIQLAELFKSSLGKAQKEALTLEGIRAQAHMKICARLLAYRLTHPKKYENTAPLNLFAIGDSHCLCMAGLTLMWKAKETTVRSLPIRGVKMFHLGSSQASKYKVYFEQRLKTLPEDSEILLSIGEIDCRPNEGIFPQAHRHTSNMNFYELTEKTVDDFVVYVTSVARLFSISPCRITLMGVPQPGYDVANRLPPKTSESQFLDFVAHVNNVMYTRAHAAGWSFLDVNGATKAMTSSQAAVNRIDEIHMSPEFYDGVSAWLREAPIKVEN